MITSSLCNEGYREDNDDEENKEKEEVSIQAKEVRIFNMVDQRPLNLLMTKIIIITLVCHF